jgi:hypothetical protein
MITTRRPPRRVPSNRRPAGGMLKMSSSARHSYQGGYRAISIDAFLEIEDVELQRYILSTQMMNSEFKAWSVNTDEKIGFYRTQVDIKLNTTGTPYRKSKLLEWIVYDKISKKVKMSTKTDYTYDYFLKHHFVETEIIKDALNGSLTKTFVKRVIEGKISTLRDVMQYHKSFTLKRKDVSLETIFKFTNRNARHLLTVLETPDDLGDYSMEDVIENVDGRIAQGKLFMIKTEDLGRVKEKHEQWIIEQNKKYDILTRDGDAKSGSLSGEGIVA